MNFITSLTGETVEIDTISKFSNASLFWIITLVHSTPLVGKSLSFARNSEHNSAAKISENAEY
jgi:hypothetical protein